MPDFRPCLLIPVYNHGSEIAATLERLNPFGLPCIVVDDGSEPSTANVLDALAAQHPTMVLLRLTHNSGKGAAVMYGVSEAHRLGYTHALQIDADGQHDTNDIPTMLSMAKKEPTALISGAPQYGDDVPKARLYGRYITHFWVWIETLSTDIVDTMCGLRVYPVATTFALIQRTTIGKRMTFDIEIMVRLYWEGLPIRFFKTRVHYPKNGVSHFRLWQDNLQISGMHTKLVIGMLLRLPQLLLRRILFSKNNWQPESKKHWSQQQERGSEWGLRFCLWCYQRLGKRVLLFLLYPIIAWFFLFASSARRESRRYLQRVLPHKPTTLDSFQHFLAFGRIVVDKLSAWSGEIQRQDVTFSQRELLLQQATSGKGAVILTSHLGNADMCRALIKNSPDVRMNVLLFTHNAAAINHILQQANPTSGLEIIQINDVGPDTIMLLHNKIQGGEFVVIAADRTSPTAKHRVTQAPFLGKEAPFPQGPFILAALLECPVFLLFALHTPQGYEIHLEPFADQLYLPRRQRTEHLQATISRYAERLEYYCKQAPLQWFNFFNFWQDND